MGTLRFAQATLTSLVGHVLAEQRDLLRDRRPLALQVIGDGAAQARIGDLMRAVGLRSADSRARACARPARRPRRAPARARWRSRWPGSSRARNAGTGCSSMRAPVAAVERVAADEVERAGDVAAVALGHDQQHPVGHAARRAG